MQTRMVLSGLLVFSLLASFVCCRADAQSEEPVLVPSKAILVGNINMKKIISQVDLEAAHVKPILEMMMDESGVGLENFDQVFIAIDEESEGDRFDMEDALSVMLKMNRKIDKNQVMEKWFSGTGFTARKLERDSIYVGDTEWGTAPSLYFDGESMVIAKESRLVSMLNDQNPARPKVMKKIDKDAELSFALDLSSIEKDRKQKLVQSIVGDMMGGGGTLEVLNELSRFEIHLKSDDGEPLLANLEMSSNDAAQELKEMIDMGLKMLPAGIEMARTEVAADGVPPGIAKSAKELLDMVKDMHENASLTVDGNTIVFKVEKMGGYPNLTRGIFEVGFLGMMGISSPPMVEEAVPEVRLDDDDD